MGLLGILVGLGLLIFLSYRSWSVLLVAPLAALDRCSRSGRAASCALDQTFMGGAAQFLAQFFPLCLLGAVFGKVMQDSGSSAGTLDSLPYNGAVVTLLAVCGMTHRESNRDIVMVAIVSAPLALAAVIVLGSIFGSF